jgi:hypothetical protein
MVQSIVPSEFLGSNRRGLLNTCRHYAGEAARSAMTAATPETRRSWLELKRQWEILAEELEAWRAPDEPQTAERKDLHGPQTN